MSSLDPRQESHDEDGRNSRERAVASRGGREGGEEERMRDQRGRCDHPSWCTTREEEW